GPQLEPAASAGRARPDALPGLPAPDAGALRQPGRRRVRRPVDGGDLLLRLLGLYRAGRGARALLQLPGLPLGPRNHAPRLPADPRVAPRRLPRGRPERDARLAGP